MIKKSVGEFEEEPNHQEKYFQFYENKRWLTAQTVPLCVELPKDFHFLLNSKPKKVAMPILKRQFFLLNSTYCKSLVRSRRGNAADRFTSGRVQVLSKKWKYCRYKQRFIHTSKQESMLV